MDSSARNVSHALSIRAEEAPERIAVVDPHGAALKFEALERRVRRLTAGLRALGFAAGDRVVLAVPPGVELVALVHALFRVGAAPVLLDPGLGRAQLLACIARVAPRGLVR